MYTIDASVWVNAFDRREPGHATSRQFLDLVRTRADAVIVPHLVCVEVAGAISRTRRDPDQALALATSLAGLPNVQLVPLDEDLARRAEALAARHGLRGADAVYAAVAQRTGCTLVSLDREHLTRLATIVRSCTPAQALSQGR